MSDRDELALRQAPCECAVQLLELSANYEDLIVPPGVATRKERARLVALKTDAAERIIDLASELAKELAKHSLGRLRRPLTELASSH